MTEQDDYNHIEGVPFKFESMEQFLMMRGQGIFELRNGLRRLPSDPESIITVGDRGHLAHEFKETKKLRDENVIALEALQSGDKNPALNLLRIDLVTRNVRRKIALRQDDTLTAQDFEHEHAVLKALYEEHREIVEGD